MEAGLTVGTKTTSARGWLGFDVSPGLSFGKQVSTSSRRFGVDFTTCGTVNGRYYPVFLLFYVYESATYTKTLDDSSRPQLTSSSQFVGVGAGLGW